MTGLGNLSLRLDGSGAADAATPAASQDRSPQSDQSSTDRSTDPSMRGTPGSSGVDYSKGVLEHCKNGLGKKLVVDLSDSPESSSSYKFLSKPKASESIINPTKLTVKLPPNAICDVVFTMRDNTTKTITFDTTGASEPVVARLAWSDPTKKKVSFGALSSSTAGPADFNLGAVEKKGKRQFHTVDDQHTNFKYSYQDNARLFSSGDQSKTFASAAQPVSPSARSPNDQVDVDES